MDSSHESQPISPEFRSKPLIEFAGKSIANWTHPDRNEDALFQLIKKESVGLFDGMGGHAKGVVASRLARDTTAEVISNSSPNISLQETEELVKDALIQANATLLTARDESRNNMGTTGIVVKLWHGLNQELKTVIGSVGDSRVYLFRNNQVLEQITLDDGNIHKYFDDDSQAKSLQLKLSNVIDDNNLTTVESLFFHQRFEITQFLGALNEPHMYTETLHEGDKLIVTSDGVHDNLTDYEIIEVLRQEPNTKVAIAKLVERARNRSLIGESHQRSKPDDISALMIAIPKAESDEFPSPLFRPDDKHDEKQTPEIKENKVPVLSYFEHQLSQIQNEISKLEIAAYNHEELDPEKLSAYIDGTLENKEDALSEIISGLSANKSESKRAAKKYLSEQIAKASDVNKLQTEHPTSDPPDEVTQRIEYLQNLLKAL